MVLFYSDISRELHVLVRTQAVKRARQKAEKRAAAVRSEAVPSEVQGGLPHMLGQPEAGRAVFTRDSVDGGQMGGPASSTGGQSVAATRELEMNGYGFTQVITQYSTWPLAPCFGCHMLFKWKEMQQSIAWFSSTHWAWEVCIMFFFRLVIIDQRDWDGEMWDFFH